jgi:hypothetical protein
LQGKLDVAAVQTKEKTFHCFNCQQLEVQLVEQQRERERLQSRLAIQIQENMFYYPQSEGQLEEQQGETQKMHIRKEKHTKEKSLVWLSKRLLGAKIMLRLHVQVKCGSLLTCVGLF